MKRIYTATFVLAAILGATVSPVSAQFQTINPPGPNPPRPAPAAPAQGQTPVVVYQNATNARDVQQQLREILDNYPPTLRQLIRLDPSLMQREDYMVAYPALVGFLQQHPEILRNP